MPRNDNRVAWSIKNTSTAGQIISLARGMQAAVSGSGQVLAPNDTISEADDTAYKAWRAEISAISSAAGGTIAIFERVRTP
jgi:hypothetical protein